MVEGFYKGLLSLEEGSVPVMSKPGLVVFRP